MPVDQQQIEAVITAEDDAASDVLQNIYSFINSDAYRYDGCGWYSRHPSTAHHAEGIPAETNIAPLREWCGVVHKQATQAEVALQDGKSGCLAFALQSHTCNSRQLLSTTKCLLFLPTQP